VQDSFLSEQIVQNTVITFTKGFFMTTRIHSALIIALASASFSVSGLAQMNHDMHGSAMAMPVSTVANAAMGEGLVKKIDKTKGTVTLAHSAQKDGMSAMTMVYRVKDVAWLDKMKVGQKIRFATDPADGGMTVVQFEPVK
jgi:Cu/Ag efflux protein CusF